MNYGRYRILEELGKGAMGVVYKAHDPQIDRLIALKVLRADKVSSREFIQRFLKEARAIGRLAHPNIVTVYDAGQDKGSVYIAEEFIEGKALHEIIREKRLPLCDVLNIGIQMAGALGYAFHRGIVHRDLKPANIMLQASGSLKIMDFGIAHMEDPQGLEQTQAGMILGTPAYMAPEQVLGHPVDGRTDIFSIGIVLYELIMGKKPFEGENLTSVLNSITQDTPSEPVNSDPEVSAAQGKIVAAIVLKCLEKDPDDRYQTGGELAEALTACLGGRTPAGLHLHRLNPRHALFAGLAALVIVAAAAGVMNWARKEVITIGPSVAVEVQAQAILNVESKPQGARIFLDGVLKGRTPLALELPPGEYEVMLSLDDYYEWTGPVKIDKKGETHLFAELTPLMF